MRLVAVAAMALLGMTSGRPGAAPATPRLRVSVGDGTDTTAVVRVRSDIDQPVAVDLAESGRAAYDPQQTNAPVDPNRRDNLFALIPGDAGAHGDFERRARSFSGQLWLDRCRRWLAVTTAAALLGGFVRWRGAGATWLLRPA
jgi:hypothetical protein